MKHKISLFILLSLFSVSLNALDLGVIVGEPTGLSAKLWKNKSVAYDAGLAWSFGGSTSALHIHTDYLLHNRTLINTDYGTFPVHYGIGLRALITDNLTLGVRIPVGINYNFNDKLSSFFEVVPILDLMPATTIRFNLGLGLRYSL